MLIIPLTDTIPLPAPGSRSCTAADLMAVSDWRARYLTALDALVIPESMDVLEAANLKGQIIQLRANMKLIATRQTWRGMVDFILGQNRSLDQIKIDIA